MVVVTIKRREDTRTMSQNGKQKQRYSLWIELFAEPVLQRFLADQLNWNLRNTSRQEASDDDHHRK